jgi:hypothetical protein
MALLLLTLDGVVRVISMVNFYFSSPRLGEEVPGGNFILRQQEEVPTQNFFAS